MRRRDIQGLRALAVGAVVLYHLRGQWFPGGFVGVDVFFVISGYLITSSLVREATETGRIRLWRFWGRRIRRLMPAATIVLVATVFGAWFVLSAAQWTTIVHQVLASAVSVQNWYLAADSVSYLHATTLPSPLQHFWSLSVEEQFYVGWPLVICAAIFIAGRVHRPRITVVRVILSALFAASLAFSVVASATDPAVSYFSTLTRAWELFVGAGLAVWLPRIRLDRRIGSVVMMSGLAAVAVSIWAVTDAMPFPGWVALVPTLGAACVIGGGLTAGWNPAKAFLEWRPMVYLGDISYSLYLWHWPVIVFLEAALGRRPLPYWACVIVVVVSVAVAALSKKFVEDVFTTSHSGRRAAPSRARSIRSSPLLVGIVALTLAVTSSVALTQHFDSITNAARASEKPDNLPGARLLDPSFDRSTYPDKPVAPVPDLASLQNIERQLEPPCLTAAIDDGFHTCTFGDARSRADILLTGDSHAAMWVPALTVLADENHWKITIAAKQSCPLIDLDASYSIRYPAGDTPYYPSCQRWNDQWRSYVVKTRPAAIVTSAADYGYPDGVAVGDTAFNDMIGAAMARQMGFALDRGIPVVAIDEVPLFSGFSAPTCLATPGATVAGCSAQMQAALQTPLSRMAIATADDSRIKSVDFDDLICPKGRCYSAIGNVISYRDDNHLTPPFAASLAWAWKARVAPDLVGIGRG